MSSKSTNSGVSTLSVIGIIFVILKLVGAINWSWWLVLLPFYFWIPVVCAIVLIIGIVNLIKGFLR